MSEPGLVPSAQPGTATGTPLGCMLGAHGCPQGTGGTPRAGLFPGDGKVKVTE